MRFGEVLRRLRIRNNLSQKELARRLNVSRSVISRVETNTSEATETLIKRASEYFEVSSDTLLGVNFREREREEKIAIMNEKSRELLDSDLDVVIRIVSCLSLDDGE